MLDSWSIAGKNEKWHYYCVKLLAVSHEVQHSPYNPATSALVTYLGELYPYVLIHACMCMAVPD